MTRYAAWILYPGLMGMASLVLADEPYYTITPYAARTYDSNVFRLSRDMDPRLFLGVDGKSDHIDQYGAAVDLNTYPGAQHLKASGAWERWNYGRFDQLDHSTRKWRGDWEWALGSLWSGDAGYGRKHYLADLADIRTKDMIDESNADLGASYLLHPDWAVGAKVSRLTSRRSTLAVWDYDSATREINFRYVGSPGNSVGVRAAWSRIDYLNPQPVGIGFIDNDYRQFDAQGTVDWTVSGASHLSGGLGFQRVHYAQAGLRDFGGTAGSLGYQWQLTGKTRVNLNGWRQVSASTSLANSVLTEGWSLAPTWSFSPKLGVQLSYRHERRDYRSAVGAVAGQRDIDTTLGTGLTYQFFREAQLALSYDAGKRDSTRPLGDYRYRAWNATFSVPF